MFKFALVFFFTINSASTAEAVGIAACATDVQRLCARGSESQREGCLLKKYKQLGPQCQLGLRANLQAKYTPAPDKARNGKPIVEILRAKGSQAPMFTIPKAVPKPTLAMAARTLVSEGSDRVRVHQSKVSRALNMGLAFTVAMVALMLASMWRLFEKAEKPGWAALIPVYNMVLLAQIGGRSRMFGFLCHIPIFGFVPLFFINLGVAQTFARSNLYGVGMTLLPFLFFPLLAFGADEAILVPDDGALFA